MKTVNMHEAKTQLSKLVAAVERGEGDVVIARAGKPVVRLVAEAPRHPRGPSGYGSLQGKISYEPDWDSHAVNVETAASMYGMSVPEYLEMEAEGRRRWEEAERRKSAAE